MNVCKGQHWGRGQIFSLFTEHNFCRFCYIFLPWGETTSDAPSLELLPVNSTLTKCPPVCPFVNQYPLPHNPSISALWPPHGCSSWVPDCLATTSSILGCSYGSVQRGETRWVSRMYDCLELTPLSIFIHFDKCGVWMRTINRHVTFK